MGLTKRNRKRGERKRSGVRWALILLPALLVLSLLLPACGDLGYYVQCAEGHLGVMAKSQPISRILADPTTSPKLREQLEKAVEIRDFASKELGLPDNGSYRSYCDVGRPYVVWNVVAAPEFSLTPVQWCFPVAGCVSYRGYFKREAAEAFAARQEEAGNEVYLYGVPAYSTLTWFDDPLLNTFLNRSGPRLAGTIFHELAHQVVYLPDDSRFNEAFATAVELEGVHRWLGSKGDSEQMSDYRRFHRRKEAVLALLEEVRGELEGLYASGVSKAEMRRRKGEILESVGPRYQALKESWGGYNGYDRLFAGLNNARLASVSTYYDLVPAFQALLAESGGNLPAFYGAVAEIARLPEPERLARLHSLVPVVARR